jgi:hypothetical protein
MVQEGGWVQIVEWYRRGEGYKRAVYRKHRNWKANRNHEIVTVDPSENSFSTFMN